MDATVYYPEFTAPTDATTERARRTGWNQIVGAFCQDFLSKLPAPVNAKKIKKDTAPELDVAKDIFNTVLISLEQYIDCGNIMYIDHAIDQAYKLCSANGKYGSFPSEMGSEHLHTSMQFLNGKQPVSTDDARDAIEAYKVSDTEHLLLMIR
ncbi:hypothetical protein HJFPF1_12148 [Paramyrothecium foliicola]|nr:hypothetical protein HJFPF1_12148 [Paramyrothecium foliicola]